MRLLLDTEVWLWSVKEPGRISAETAALIDAAVPLLSAASTWEIVLMVERGELVLQEPVDEFVRSRMHRDRVQGLLITHAHVLHVASLPALHDDATDRLLVAQAQLEKVPIVTADADIARYPVTVVRP